LLVVFVVVAMLFVLLMPAVLATLAVRERRLSGGLADW
jgi:hypothetical protein